MPIKRVMTERRAEPRMLCADMVDVHWIDPSGRPGKCTALLEDISQSGACLQFEAAMPIGAEIRIQIPQAQLQGLVRYCVYREIGYFVGMQFEPAGGWSREQFEPQHLLDLEELVLRRPGGLPRAHES